MPKVKPTCVLSESEGEKPRSALYTCSCGGQFNGLKAWREHMVARSLLHKLPERITLPGISKKKRSGRSSPNGSGRGSPMSIEVTTTGLARPNGRGRRVCGVHAGTRGAQAEAASDRL